LLINNIMSANRSVQAAQRRRAGPPDGGMPGKSPQPSINSAQIFANQARPGQGPNIPSGRLAGQQVSMQQQQMQQQQMQQQQMQQQQMQQQQMQQREGLSSVTKMSIPQAITLITLRLGIIESKLQNHPEGMFSSSESGMTMGIDPGVFESIMTRLDALEKRPVSSTSNSGQAANSDMGLVKQQVETLKQAVLQQKGSSTNLVKENVALKNQIDNLRNELTETKELLATLQNLTMDNSQKILDLSMGINEDYEGTFEDQMLQESLPTDSGFTNLEELNDENEIIGTDLKQLIENELNNTEM
jgi:hypothetical protein